MKVQTLCAILGAMAVGGAACGGQALAAEKVADTRASGSSAVQHVHEYRHLARSYRHRCRGGYRLYDCPHAYELFLRGKGPYHRNHHHGRNSSFGRW